MLCSLTINIVDKQTALEATSYMYLTIGLSKRSHKMQKKYLAIQSNPTYG